MDVNVCIGGHQHIATWHLLYTDRHSLSAGAASFSKSTVCDTAPTTNALHVIQPTSLSFSKASHLLPKRIPPWTPRRLRPHQTTRHLASRAQAPSASAAQPPRVPPVFDAVPHSQTARRASPPPSPSNSPSPTPPNPCRAFVAPLLPFLKLSTTTRTSSYAAPRDVSVTLTHPSHAPGAVTAPNRPRALPCPAPGRLRLQPRRAPRSSMPPNVRKPWLRQMPAAEPRKRVECAVGAGPGQRPCPRGRRSACPG